MSPQTDVSQAMFPWYRLVSGDSPLEQGDIFVKFPVVVPSTSISDIVGQPDEIVEVSGIVERFDVIVVTQSCDFAKMEDADDVILCPRNDYFEVVKMRPNYGGANGWRNIVAGRIIGIYPLNKCEIPGREFNYQLVDLRRIFTTPLGVVKQVAQRQGERVRLVPPYREHLAQAFAQQFMRVGLPEDLPREAPMAPN